MGSVRENHAHVKPMTSKRAISIEFICFCWDCITSQVICVLLEMLSTNQNYVVEKVRVFTPKPRDINELNAGEIGFITTGIKVLSETKVGDTICDASKPIVEALPGFKPSKPVVFCGLFPVDSSEYQKLKDGLGKLQLNDASFSFEAESS